MKRLKYLLTVLLAAILLYLFFRNENLGRVLEILGRVPVVYPLLFIAGNVVQLLIRAYRWGLLIKPYKQAVPLRILFNFTMIGYFINLFIPGRVGEAAKGVLIARDQHFQPGQGLASVLLERLIDVLTTLLLFLISFALVVRSPSPTLTRLQDIAFILIPIIVCIFLFFYLINRPGIFRFIVFLIQRLVRLLPLRIRDRAHQSAISFVRALRLNLAFADVVKLIVSSALVWLWIIPFFWMLMKGFSIHISLPETLPYYCILVMSAAIPTPGMAGSLDAGSKLGLVELFGVSGETAVAYTLFTHFLILMIWGILGFVALSMQQIKLKTVKELQKKPS